MVLGAKPLGLKIEAKRLGGKRPGGKRLVGETSCYLSKWRPQVKSDEYENKFAKLTQ